MRASRGAEGIPDQYHYQSNQCSPSGMDLTLGHWELGFSLHLLSIASLCIINVSHLTFHLQLVQYVFVLHAKK